MTAETLQPFAGPNGALLSERALARLAAHHLVQHVQQRDTGSEVAESLVVAESRGWSEVVRVLLYAEVVKVWARPGSEREVAIERLVDRAEADGDPVWLACALASRAEDRYPSASAAVREHANRDLARAVALLAAGTGGALERGTAYIDCGLAYGQRELWELAEEMYAHATALLPACEEPLLVAPLAIDRAMVNVHTACCLREMGDEDGLRRLWERACDTIGDSFGDSIGAPVGTLVGARVGAGVVEAAEPAAFGVETRVGRHLLARLAHEQPVEESAALDLALAATGAPSEGPDHGLLRLADALHAADLGGWDRVAELAATSLVLFEDDVAPPIIAMAMRLATQAAIARGRGPPPRRWPTATGAPAGAGTRACSCWQPPGPAWRQNSCGSNATSTPARHTSTS